MVAACGIQCACEKSIPQLTELISIPTAFQLADPLTKVLAGPQTKQFRAWALRGELPPDLHPDLHVT